MMSKATKDVFIEKTLQTVAEVGMENLRTKMVADAAGFSEATMFRFFPDKDKMLCDTFLEVDRRVSEAFLKSFETKALAEHSVADVMHEVWFKMYAYLLSHREETLYLIRFRYSALYTDEIRIQRMAYNGAFDNAYAALVEKGGVSRETYRGFMLNYMFEMTLCFAEKIVTGRLQNSKEMENRLWEAVSAAANVFLK